MSPNAVRVRTSSGWQDIAIQGAQGPPGRTLSCKASSSISFAAADTYYRGIGLNFTNVVFDDFGNSFSPANVWTCRQTGRYLIIASYFGLSASGAVGLAQDPNKKMHSAQVTKGADGNQWGTECVWIGDYTAGNTLALAGYHSGGGSGTFIFEAIRLDAPPIAVPSSQPDILKTSIKRWSGEFERAMSGTTELWSSVAGDLRHTITPIANLWWEVDLWMLTRVADAAWYSVDLRSRLYDGAFSNLLTDELGFTDSPQVRVMAHSGAGPWWEGRLNYMYKLKAGVTYGVVFQAIPGAGSWYWLSGSNWLGSSSKVAGYW